MRRCDCGCKRPARVEWIHPIHGSFHFGALCTIRLGQALRDQGWHDYPNLDDQPIVIIVGADPRECG
jgi:hypothetical protein